MPKLVKDGPTSAEYLRDLEQGGNRKQNVKVAFSNLSAHVRLPDGKKKSILDGISGSAHMGQVMAVMGPTGCGKTTFLSALSHRLDSSVALSDESKITWGGQSWSPALKRRIGFIEQDDVTFPHLTVREALTFAARLRISGSDGYRAQRVDQLLGEMHLEGCSDVLIGGGLVRGISGGQRKRVCIATELISKPKFLFCDEPTSGLVCFLFEFVICMTLVYLYKSFHMFTHYCV
jgi:ABC-type multidrug transport system ATPase subunit